MWSTTCPGFVMAAGGSDIGGLIELLDGRVGSYVFCSSIMAYDQSLAGIFPWTEDLPSNPEGTATYGGFKAVAEQLMLERHAATGFPASVVRPAAIYGPENNIYDMETPMFLRLLQSRPILVPHGGLVAGSYGHVDDLCELMVAMAEMPGGPGRDLQRHRRGTHVAALRHDAGRDRRCRTRHRADPRRHLGDHLPTGVQPPLRRPPPRHRQHRQGPAAARLPPAI